MKRLWRLAVALRICPEPFSRPACSLRVLLQDAYCYQRGKPSLTINQEAGGDPLPALLAVFASGSIP